VQFLCKARRLSVTVAYYSSIAYKPQRGYGARLRKEQTISERFGQAVKAVREAQGISQEKLAELAEIDRTYVSMIERGKRHPTLEVASRIAIALSLRLSEIIRQAEDRKAS
jgi:ribosome-binding protein aMBF1 (putative translation factor)